MKFQDYYQIMGVERTASADAIKKAYRKLAMEWHPDRQPPHRRKEAEEKFKRIAEANEVLSDPEKRKRYDALGEHWRQGQDFQPPPGGGFRTVTPEEFARMFGGAGSGGGPSGGGFSDFFANLFGDFFQQGGNDGAPGAGPRGGRRAAPAATAGEDVEAELELAVGEAWLGGKRSLQLEASVACERCGGEGRVGRQVCPNCGGLGRVRRPRQVDLQIPKDVYDGQVVRLRGLGEPGSGGNGDLLLELRLVPDDAHRLRGDDVEADVVVTPWAALDGTKVEIKVPSGTATARIPPGTKAGTKLRLRGQGLARRDGGRSDLLLVVRLALPESLTEKQRELLRQAGRGG
ncbi:MAG TPA: DnaJ C-terminal domain-containing protein [Planctomycetota bacterium]|nr:DnaJ C-terminal domain-containing protein [Planctomycetota bacterium]